MINRLNTLAWFAGYEIVSDVNGQVYLIKKDKTSVAVDSVRDGVMLVPMEFRKGLMNQWLIRNDSLVTPMYNDMADANAHAEKRLEIQRRDRAEVAKEIQDELES